MMSHRWGDSAHTFVIRAADGAQIPASPANSDYAAALASGVAAFVRWADLDAAKAALAAEIEARASALRAAVAGTAEASKLIVYQTKYETALAALGGDTAALAALAPEAAARGQSAAALATLVKSLGEAWRAAGLAIDAAYQTHKAAILALSDLAAADAYDASAGWPGA